MSIEVLNDELNKLWAIEWFWAFDGVPGYPPDENDNVNSILFSSVIDVNKSEPFPTTIDFIRYSEYSLLLRGTPSVLLF
jgi:hypothetical protein